MEPTRGRRPSQQPAPQSSPQPVARGTPSREVPPALGLPLVTREADFSHVPVRGEQRAAGSTPPRFDSLPAIVQDRLVERASASLSTTGGQSLPAHLRSAL